MRGRAVRGRPLATLVVLLALWAAMRIVLWESPFAAAGASPSVEAPMSQFGAGTGSVDRSLARATGQHFVLAPGKAAALHPGHRSVRWPVRSPRVAPATDALDRLPLLPHYPTSSGANRQDGLFANGPSRQPLPTGTAPPAPFRLPAPEVSPSRRWSGDAWLFVRPGTAEGSAADGRFAAYGGSQAGAVLRYRLIPRSAYQPAAYLRATAALTGLAERDLALGLSGRPVKSLPLTTHAEIRLSEIGERREVRPAVFAVVAPGFLDLPAGFRGEASAQAGYVGGRFATAFADGQARVDRSILSAGVTSLHAGAGAWAGAQEGAARLDIGPSARAQISVSGLPARLQVDYRIRVMGAAKPDSGVALTISTGF